MEWGRQSLVSLKEINLFFSNFQLSWNSTPPGKQEDFSHADQIKLINIGCCYIMDNDWYIWIIYGIQVVVKCSWHLSASAFLS